MVAKITACLIVLDSDGSDNEIEDKLKHKKRKRDTKDKQEVESAEPKEPVLKKQKSNTITQQPVTPFELPTIDESSGPTCQLRVSFIQPPVTYNSQVRLTTGAMLSVTLPLSAKLSLLYRFIQLNRTDIVPEVRSDQEFTLICMYPKKSFTTQELQRETLESAGFGNKVALLIEDVKQPE